MNNEEFEDFVSDLKELCLKHKIVLRPGEHDVIYVLDDSEEQGYYFNCQYIG